MADWKRRLHDAVDELDDAQGEALARSKSKFLDWAINILQQIGMLLEQIRRIMSGIMNFWFELRNAFGF